MNVCVLGTGYVGLVTGVCLADIGHSVECVDIDAGKVARLKNGVMPIHEEGLEQLVAKNCKRLKFTTDAARAVSDVDIVIIAVGTPPKEDGSCDMSQVEAAFTNILENAKGYTVVMNKSTVSVGTQTRFKQWVGDAGREDEIEVVSCPEFLQEGTAIRNMMAPDRIVIGADSERAANVVLELFAPVNAPKLVVTPESSELIKYASNAFLGVKISFINEIANLCETTGADVRDVAKGMGLDPRIGGLFLKAGIGFGGSCFPKDMNALISSASERGVELSIIRAALSANERQHLRCFEKLKSVCPELSGKTVAVWGLTFKPKTDDVRCAPAFANVEALLGAGARVRVYDPLGMDGFRRECGTHVNGNVTYCESPEDAARGAHAVLLLTEWREFAEADMAEVKAAMSSDVFIDGRNALDAGYMKELGFRYMGVGR